MESMATNSRCFPEVLLRLREPVNDYFAREFEKQ